VTNVTLEQAHFVSTYPWESEDMESAQFYQCTADAMGVPLYFYPDGSVTNVRKIGAEPTATIEPQETWRPADDHGLGDRLRQPWDRRLGAAMSTRRPPQREQTSRSRRSGTTFSAPYTPRNALVCCEGPRPGQKRDLERSEAIAII